MSTSEESGERLDAELLAVLEAASARLRADTEEDHEAARAAADRLLAAATSAIGAGYSLKEIAGAEAQGQTNLRNELRNEELKRVERSGRHARDAEADHHRAIARAVRLGLSTREIAAAAGITHGTVRTISSRIDAERPSVKVVTDQPTESHDESAPSWQ